MVSKKEGFGGLGVVCYVMVLWWVLPRTPQIDFETPKGWAPRKSPADARYILYSEDLAQDEVNLFVSVEPVRSLPLDNYVRCALQSFWPAGISQRPPIAPPIIVVVREGVLQGEHAGQIPFVTVTTAGLRQTMYFCRKKKYVYILYAACSPAYGEEFDAVFDGIARTLHVH